jgi:hypothetical protein
VGEGHAPVVAVLLALAKGRWKAHKPISAPKQALFPGPPMFGLTMRFAAIRRVRSDDRPPRNLSGRRAHLRPQTSAIPAPRDVWLNHAVCGDQEGAEGCDSRPLATCRRRPCPRWASTWRCLLKPERCRLRAAAGARIDPVASVAKRGLRNLSHKREACRGSARSRQQLPRGARRTLVAHVRYLRQACRAGRLPLASEHGQLLPATRRFQARADRSGAERDRVASDPRLCLPVGLARRRTHAPVQAPRSRMGRCRLSPVVSHEQPRRARVAFRTSVPRFERAHTRRRRSPDDSRATGPARSTVCGP